MKKILVVLDGASGLPVNFFGGKTPLDAAETPNLDFLVEQGKMGYMYPINEKIVPGSDNSLISIFGNNPNLVGRGVLEAVGLGIKLTRGDLALRTNFGTIDNLKSKVVVDRRAGRTLTTKEAREIERTLNKNIRLPCKFEFKSSVQHKGVLILRGGFSDNITNVDNEWMSLGGKKEKKFKYSEPLDDEENSKYTVNILNEFIDQAFRILSNHPVNLERKKKGLLPVNMVFMRGPGVKIPELKEYNSWMSINPMPLEIGIAKLLGMKDFSFEYPELKSIDVYENLYYALNKDIKFAIKTIKKFHKDYIGCYIQFKETDVPGHDNKPHEKRKMLEIIDKKFFGFLRKFIVKNPMKVVVTCDHSTPCKLKAHSRDPVPVLVYGDGKDNTSKFSEKQSRKGDLGKFYGKEFMKKTGLSG